MTLKALLIAGMFFGLPTLAFAQETSDSYTVCGCGCCPSDEDKDLPVTCVKDKAELQRLTETDKNFLETHQDLCAVAGCAKGRKYALCNKPAVVSPQPPISQTPAAIVVVRRKPLFGLR